MKEKWQQSILKPARQTANDGRKVRVGADEVEATRSTGEQRMRVRPSQHFRWLFAPVLWTQQRPAHCQQTNSNQ